MDKHTAVALLKKHPLVPLFYNDDRECCKLWIKSCYDGGVRVVEFTNRGEDALDIFAELHQWSRETCPGLVLGIGTVKDLDTAAAFKAAGAGFIVAPVLDIEVGVYCNAENLLWIPGCATLTEMYHGYRHGAGVVKAFPVHTLGGPDFIKSVLAPCPELRIMVSGGVEATRESYDDYIKAGAFCVGTGSSLFSVTGNKSASPEQIRKRCETILSDIS
ncbi:2-dehydro-3-deoxyphosphogluconate aldolase / (4S)-4-hydroxy-2-oxoglutarate aldolase [Sinomicrobium oceani]|uniref:2-dehydro-3-deoxyphosphogluconate aldolase / (4S)-4-hydroxy-2-oxoglutarate aldolase n=1 Tax=Sinomicrobium oceani TaxID=1150368 RepID=A0A1K1PW93_9FLAO|nr:hypothetical protein [Sinomicrobium oceani]SFW51715.1 2-dehydro-3-deoxyphosphogluconate aldolase / (4S)-4-hydroxy-2-oxoglutarate aldolase [Sinomicrobium oceani]